MILLRRILPQPEFKLRSNNFFILENFPKLELLRIKQLEETRLHEVVNVG